MQLKQRLQINIAVSVIAALITALILILTLIGVNRARHERELAGAIMSSLYERITFRSDYLRSGNERARVQWFAKSEQIDRLLMSALSAFNGADDRETVEELIKDDKAVVKLFSNIVKNRESARSGSISTELHQEVENRLLTQLNMRLYENALDTIRLSESAGAHLHSAQILAGWSIFFVIMIVVAAAVANSRTIGRTIIDRIRLLQDGAAIIGQGNLDHRIEIKGDDEFARLSNVFNRMSANLGASYLRLENEISERRKSEEALRESERHLRRFYESGMIGVIYWDMDGGRIRDANDKFLEMVRYGREELQAGGITWPGMTPPEYAALDEHAIAELRSAGVVTPYEKECIRKDGSRIPIIVGAAMLDEERHKGVAFVLDITARKRAENLNRLKTFSEELNKISTIVHSTLNTESIMTLALKEAVRVLGVDGASAGTFEKGSSSGLSIRYSYNAPDSLHKRCCSPEEAKGIWYMARSRDVCAFDNLATDERVNADFWKSFGFSSMLAAPLIVGTEVIGAMMFFTKAPFFFEDVRINFARHLSATLALAFDNARLYEQRGKMEEEMRHVAHHDPLTGLPNRRLFVDIMNVECEQASRNRKKMAVLFLDLDRFKEVNDTLGHDAGDMLLKEAASRIKSLLRKSDTIARIGGDEFNIVLADIVRSESIADIARNIIDSFRKPFHIKGNSLNITTSIGISIYPDDNKDADTLLKYADIAMYHAKEVGRNGYHFYNHTMNVKSLERMRLEAMLRRSLDLGEMQIWYQPVVDIRTRRVVAAEALARWRHPDKGLLLPRAFIPAAEATGFINELGEWSLKAVCRQMRAWQDAGGNGLPITVNLSARQFQDPELVDKISSILREADIPPERLGIEITETVAMSDVERTAGQMRKLTKMGIQVSVDDFGTGYSSLNYLKKLPIKRLKIDKTFIRDIATDSDDRSIVQAVTAMAHSMKMKVVAEGVETEEQLEFLKRTGSDEMQGFLYSEPLPAQEFEELANTGKGF